MAFAKIFCEAAKMLHSLAATITLTTPTRAADAGGFARCERARNDTPNGYQVVKDARPLAAATLVERFDRQGPNMTTGKAYCRHGIYQSFATRIGHPLPTQVGCSSGDQKANMREGLTQ